MKKKIFLPLWFLFCSNNVFGEQVKKMTDKEFVVKKHRNDSFENVQKPKYFAINSDEQKFSLQKFSLQDIELEIKTLPIDLDLQNKEKKIHKVKHNLVRLGMGMGFQPEDKYFAHVADVLLKKKFNNFSTHLILKSRNPFYPGWLQSLQFFADYKATKNCKPFFIFDQNFKSFKVGKKDSGIKKSSDLDFDFNLGCPLIFEKSEFFPSLDFRISNFNSLREIEGNKKEEKGTENEVNLNFDFSLDIVDKFKFSCESFIKNLNYDKKFPILDLQDSKLKELGDATNVTFLSIRPKFHFFFDKFDFNPKFCLDYCSNKKFVKDSSFYFLVGGRVGYEIHEQVNLYFDIDNGLKSNTFRDLFKKNPWLTQQAVMANKDNLGLALGIDTKISNFKINFEFGVNDFNNFPNFSDVKEENEKLPNYSLEYLDVTRFKEMLGVSFEMDSFEALLSGSLYQYKLQDDKKILYQPSFKLKSDIFFSIIDKILLHLNLRALGGIKSKNKNSENEHEVLPLSFNIGVGVDYIFSDLFTFFFNCENLLKNSLAKYDDCPAGMLKIIFGMTMTPDRWIEKDLGNE